MRRSLVSLALSALALPLAAGSHYGHHGMSIRTEESRFNDCGDLEVTYDGRQLQVVTEEVPLGSVRSLDIRSSRNGGIRVIGGSGGYRVTACKASALSDPRDIRVRVDGDTVSAEREDIDETVVYFLVHVPRNATVQLSATNGPIGVDSVDGTVKARALNGPIAVKESSGTMNITTVNGPISFSGESGNVKLDATNGPIAIRLLGSGWGAGSLEASTQNGPVSLKLPRDYRSGVLVESDGHGPLTCRAAACRDVRRFDNEGNEDRPRRIELGSGARSVTVSTVNGPIAIREG